MILEVKVKVIGKYGGAWENNAMPLFRLGCFEDFSLTFHSICDFEAGYTKSLKL